MPGMKISVQNEGFGIILNCAARYALGRRSYMPGLVVDFITPLLPHASNHGGYGDPDIDEPVWMRFHEAVRAEETHRGMHLYKDWRGTNGA